MSQRSFKNFVNKHFYNELFSRLENYIRFNRSEIEIWSNSIDVEHIKGNSLNLEDMTIESIYINGDIQVTTLEFDVCVSVEISFSQTSNRYGDSEDSNIIWFRINCLTILNDAVKSFKIESIEQYTKGEKSRFKYNLSDSLVPIISKDNLDLEAERFLKLYFPSALEFPQFINPLQVADKMGLKVEYQNITDDLNILGQIYFKDVFVKDEQIKAGTVLIDPRIINERGQGAFNNTLMHECIHWHKHRLAFELERLYDSDLSKISTVNLDNGIGSSTVKTSIDWMEWQASTLAPKILMPKVMFKQQAELTFRELAKENPTTESVDLIIPVIERLADFFGVSKLSAKIRLVETGFEEAAGALIYIDGKYVQPHSWKKGSIDVNQTYAISFKDLKFIRFANRNLSELIDSGAFAYVDAHIVLNDEKYITTDGFGKTILTNYARYNMNECCLTFTIVADGAAGRSSTLQCILNRDDRSILTFKMMLSNDSNISVIEKAKQNQENLQKLQDILKSIAGLDFGETLKWLMSYKPRMTVEELTEYSGISEKTLGRMRNEKDYDHSLEKIIAICIAMQLHPKISKELILKSGLQLHPFAKSLHMLYDEILVLCNTLTIDECNELLIAAEFEPLIA